LQKNTNKPNNKNDNANDENNLEQKKGEFLCKKDFIIMIIFFIYFLLPFIYSLILRLETKKVTLLFIWGIGSILWFFMFPFRRHYNVTYKNKTDSPFEWPCELEWTYVWMAINAGALLFMWHFKDIY
jgi:hypothetical protein